MRTKAKKIAFAGFVGCASVAGVFLLMPASTVPDLRDFTAKRLEAPGVFYACDKETPSLKVQITGDDGVMVNGILSKVTFSTKVPLAGTILNCTGLRPEESREVRTSVYSLNISKTAGALIISNLKNLQTEESMPGVWVYKWVK